MKQCMQVVEQMGGQSPIPKRTSTSSQGEFAPKGTDFSVAGDAAGSNTRKRSSPTSKTPIAILPRPPNGPDQRLVATPHSPSQPAQPKKRGRPSRADKAKRDLRPNLPPHLAPRVQHGFGHRAILPAAPRSANHVALPQASIFSTGDGRQTKRRRLAALGQNQQGGPNAVTVGSAASSPAM